MRAVRGDRDEVTQETGGRTGSARFGDGLFRTLALGSALLVVLAMAGMFLELLVESWPAIERFGIGFLWTNAWDPVRHRFGALPAIWGTLVSTAVAMVLALPLSLAIALFLVELAPPVVSKPVGVAVELLAAIPSIVYGMWGLFVFAPYMARHVQPFLSRHLGFLPFFSGPPMGIGMLSAGIILALMILPFITAVARDVIAMVPPVLKESAYGMGSTMWEVTRKVTARYGLTGLVGAAFLGLGRAVGETMAVTFVIGNEHKISWSLFAPSNSIASTLANEFTEAADRVYLSSLIALGLVLFLISLLIQVLLQLWLGRLKRKLGGVA